MAESLGAHLAETIMHLVTQQEGLRSDIEVRSILMSKDCPNFVLVILFVCQNARALACCFCC
jgi:hypothetical protein